VTRQALRLLAGMGFKPETSNVYNVQLQATIPFALENKLADVGVVKSDSRLRLNWRLQVTLFWLKVRRQRRG
jgi:hypothetical protein